MEKQKKFVCEKCGKETEGKLSRTFLGFPKAKCSSCNHTNLFHLTSGYRAIYIVAIVLGVVWFFGSLATGEIAAPGILSIAGVIALIKDHKLVARGRL